MNRLLVGAALAVLAVLLAVAYGSGWKARDAEAQRVKVEQAKAEQRLLERTVTISQDVGVEVEQRAVEIRERTRVIKEQVPVYVTREADARCDVPAGFVQLHDAAAAGATPSPAQSPDAPSGVAISSVAETVVDNYGTCLEWRNQVLGWQDWYSRLQGLRGAQPAQSPPRS